MHTFRSVIAVVLLTVSAAFSTLASSAIGIPTRVGGQSLRWKSGVIRVSLSTSLTQANFNIKNDSEVVAAVTRSFQAWEDVADVRFEWEFVESDNVSAAGLAGDGISLVTIAPTAENALLFGRNVDAEAARTRVFYSPKGVISEADIVLNPYQLFSTDGTFGTYDLQATLTHELGHLLGLRHSSVLGAAMSDSLSKNGLFGLSDLRKRDLDESDVTALREIYGAADDDLCCGAVTGKLVLPAIKGIRNVQIWAEERETGRVAGLGELASDGTFRIAGLAAANYTIYWQRRDDLLGVMAGQLGTVTVTNDETATLTNKITTRRSAIDVRYVGLNGQLAQSAIGFRSGQEYTLYIGGTDLDPASMNIEAGSAGIKIDRSSFLRQEFGAEVTAISFRVQLADDIKPGAYSIFVSRNDGSRTALIGALRVERSDTSTNDR